jgi:hypothetical protein
MQPLGEGFGQPVGEHLHHDRAVVVVGRFQRRDARLDAARRHREGADPVAHAARFRGDEVGQAQVGAALGLVVLLSQVVPGHEHLAPALIAIDLDIVVVHLGGRVDRQHAVGDDPLLRHDA